MIFEISKDFCEKAAPADMADILSDIAKMHHYIIADNDTRSLLNEIMENHGSSNDKKYWRIFKDYSGFRPQYLKTYLKYFTINKDFDIHKFHYLSSEPAHVFLENKNYEWPAYIIDIKIS